MSRILGLDYGSVRVGVAISDALHLTAQGQSFIKNDEALIPTILQLIESRDIDKIILGNPLHLSGQESQKSEEVRQFQQQLQTQTSCEIILRDERLSTKAAQRHLIEMDVSRQKRKQKIDSMAAVFMLQGYLDAQTTSVRTQGIDITQMN